MEERDTLPSEVQKQELKITSQQKPWRRDTCLKSWRKESCQPAIEHPEKLFFKNEGKLKAKTGLHFQYICTTTNKVVKLYIQFYQAVTWDLLTLLYLKIFKYIIKLTLKYRKFLDSSHFRTSNHPLLLINGKASVFNKYL